MAAHDIMLYAAIMQKAQELNWRNFQIDLFYKQTIVEKLKKTPNYGLPTYIKHLLVIVAGNLIVQNNC
jgi:hypothetical protein